MKTLQEIKNLIDQNTTVSIQPQLLFMIYEELTKMRDEVKHLEWSLEKKFLNKYQV